MKALILCLLLVSATLSVQAVELDTLVVTGTREERVSRESPVRAEVVEAQEIRADHARNLREALENVPGIQLREVHGKSGAEVWMQGFSADRVLVLIDGMPVTPTTGSAVDVSQIMMLDIERIEVVKGATSSLYGSAAMGGVINVITKSVEPGWHAEIEADGGSYLAQNPSGNDKDIGRSHGQLRVWGGAEQWRMRAAVAREHSDGFDDDLRSWTRPGNALERTTADARLEWHGQTSPARFYVSVTDFSEQSAQRLEEDTNADNVLDPLGRDEWIDKVRLGLGGQGRAGDTDLQLDVLRETLEINSEKRNLGFYSLYDLRTAELQTDKVSLRAGLPDIGLHAVLLGVEYHRDTLHQYKRANVRAPRLCEVTGCSARRHSDEFFIQDNWLVTDQLEALLGARIQYDSDFGRHAAPKINLRYQWLESYEKNIFWRLGWGGAYRVPNLKERYFVFDHSSLGYVVQGNPQLKPEVSENWQLGVGMQFNENLTLDINGFYNTIDDLVQTEFARINAANIAVYSYANLDSAITYGADVGLARRFGTRLKLSLGYTWLQTEDRLTGQALTRRPEHQATLQSDYRITDRLDLAVKVRGQSRELVNSVRQQYSPNWTVTDIKLNYTPHADIDLFAGLDNALNRQRDFFDPNDFSPEQGRFGYLGFRWRL